MARMYNQTGNLYQGVFDCLFKTIRTEGVFAIYKGFFAHLARILPHTVCAIYWSGPLRILIASSLQILTLSLAEQTNKLMRRVEDRVLSDDLREKL